MESEGRRPGGPPSVVDMLREKFDVPAAPALGRKEAAHRVREAAGERAHAPASLVLSDQPVARGALFDAAGARVPFPEGKAYDRCYVALLDPSPMTRWAHPAWWAFVPAGGEDAVVLRHTELPESGTGSVRLLSLEPPP
jgi:hypothetical protein